MSRAGPPPPRRFGQSATKPDTNNAPSLSAGDLEMLAARGTITRTALAAIRFFERDLRLSGEHALPNAGIVRVDGGSRPDGAERAIIGHMISVERLRRFDQRCGQPTARLLRALVLRDQSDSTWRSITKAITGETGMTEQAVRIRAAAEETLEVFTGLGVDLTDLERAAGE